MNGTCGMCRYWEVATYEKMDASAELSCGYCHRYPPSVPLTGVYDGPGAPLMQYPMVYAGEGACGEFKALGGSCACWSATLVDVDRRLYDIQVDLADKGAMAAIGAVLGTRYSKMGGAVHGDRSAN